MQNLELTKERNIQNLELATGFAVSGWVLLANLEGISDEESLVQPQEVGNCVNWVAGHILMARGGLPIRSTSEWSPTRKLAINGVMGSYGSLPSLASSRT